MRRNARDRRRRTALRAWRGARAAARIARNCSYGLATRSTTASLSESHVGRLGLRAPRVDGSPAAARARRSSITVEQVGAGDAVDHAVVHLRDQRPVAVLETLDHPHLPQRLGAVELLRHHPADEVAQLLLAARRRQRGVAQVVAEVEVRVVDPHRPAELERHEAHLLAVARHERQLAGDHRRRRRRTAAAGPRRSPTEPMCMWFDVVLDVQERRVQRAHAIDRHVTVPLPNRVH